MRFIVAYLLIAGWSAVVFTRSIYRWFNTIPNLDESQDDTDRLLSGLGGSVAALIWPIIWTLLGAACILRVTVLRHDAAPDHDDTPGDER